MFKPTARFKPNITFCRSNQIRFVGLYRSFIPINLFCSLIFMSSVTEIQLNKLRSLFPARFAPMTASHTLSWKRCAQIIGANRARSLFNCISVTDDIKFNEQNKSIGIGSLYLQTEFEAI